MTTKQLTQTEIEQHKLAEEFNLKLYTLITDTIKAVDKKYDARYVICAGISSNLAGLIKGHNDKKLMEDLGVLVAYYLENSTFRKASDKPSDKVTSAFYVKPKTQVIN